MKPGRIVTIAAVAFVMGCSGPTEMTPLLEPDGDGRTAPSASAAQPDTLDCLPEGTEFGDKADEPTPPCCPGLTRAESYKGSILRLDECEKDGSGHAFCIRCGDGKCAVGENTCSCAADCKWP
jgi:hypothetical protein